MIKLLFELWNNLLIVGGVALILVSLALLVAALMRRLPLFMAGPLMIFAASSGAYLITSAVIEQQWSDRLATVQAVQAAEKAAAEEALSQLKDRVAERDRLLFEVRRQAALKLSEAIAQAVKDEADDPKNCGCTGQRVPTGILQSIR
jgi:hypothetical protein